MWSGVSVAHTPPVQEDLGLILTQIQMALSDLSSPFFWIKHVRNVFQQHALNMKTFGYCNDLVNGISYSFAQIDTTKWCPLLL